MKNLGWERSIVFFYVHDELYSNLRYQIYELSTKSYFYMGYYVKPW